MAPHDLVLIVGLTALAIAQVSIYFEASHRSGAARRRGKLRPVSMRNRGMDDVPSRWPRAG